MNTATFPMPGALRWRAVHPLIDGDGSCTLIYDLERAAVLEVPEELQFYVAPALETGDPDDELLSWLVGEDLLTTESRAPWSVEEGEAAVPGWRRLWTIQRCDDEVHAHLAPASEEAAREELAAVFKQSRGAARVRLSFDWGEGCPAPGVLDRLLAEADRLAARAQQEASCELVLDACGVTPAAAAFLAASPCHLRVRCGAFPPSQAASLVRRDWQMETSRLFLLLGAADRMTVQCALADGARLLDLWSWAKRTGLRRLDAVRQDLGGGDGAPTARVREYRHDLLAVAEEIAAELGARRLPIDFRPLTRMLRRLMGSEQPGSPDSEVWGAVPEAASPCRGCWARYLCNHSTLLAAPAGDAREPSPERCPFWLAEAEAALRLYHRLAQCEPLDVLRLLGDTAHTPPEPLGRRGDPPPPALLF